jgi:putative protease
MAEIEIGKVIDFFAKPVVAGVKLTAPLKVGDKIHFKGHSTNLEMIVTSMEINNRNANAAASGDEVGIKLPDKVRHGDTVWKITD